MSKVKGADALHCDLRGFDTTFRPKFPIIGANGINLQDKWKDYPVDAYMAVTVADMPNVRFAILPRRQTS